MAPVDPVALATLRTTLSSLATVHLPSDPGYSVKRWAPNSEKPAALVVCPATPDDVVQILAFVQGQAPYQSQLPLEFAVKGGGYSTSGASSCDGGLIIDLQPKMCNVRIDPIAKLAYVGAGCIWEQVDEAAIKHGLATVSAAINKVGVGGSTLSGGLGWLVGQYGLTIDNLVQATTVTSSGEILTASGSNHADLFWALRGGGSYFGVVTEFVYKLHEQQPDLYSSVLVFPPPRLEAVVSEINAWLAERTNNENAICVFTQGKTVKQPVFVLHLVYNGDPEEGARRFERFVKLKPVHNQSETTSYNKLNTLQNEHTAGGGSKLLRANYIPSTPAGIPVALATGVLSLWTTFIKQHPAAENSIIVIELYHPDKWSSIPSDATAYVDRAPRFNVFQMIRWTDNEFTAHAFEATRGLSQSFVKIREGHISGSLMASEGFPSYLDEDGDSTNGPEPMVRRFGTNYSRLIEIKRKYDPSGLFNNGLIS